jgi:AAA domain-containing protein
MAFTLKAENGSHALDRTEVMRALSILIDPGSTFELRSLPSGRHRICQGQSLPAAVDAAWELSDDKGIYFCLNPLPFNQDHAARDRDILSRRWLLIDVDTQRPESESNATESEKCKSLETAGRILDYLTDLGWPCPLVVDSGNGWHLLYRVDLPADKLSQQLVKGVLAELGRQFDDAYAKVDKNVHNASRICKLPGTWVRKGPDTQGRPHRLSKIQYEPDELRVVTVEQLSALVAPEKAPATKTSFTAHASNGKGLESYCRTAIERECARVCMAPEGERNVTLNAAAFSLGTLASWPEMIGLDAQRSLETAAKRAGLAEWEIGSTIRSGWEAGVAKPRTRPVEPHTNGKVVSSDLGDKLTEGLDEIEPELVNWLYENRIAPGFISIFAGRTGYGKSFVVCDLVAALSRGDMLPFSTLKQNPTRTLFISEDSPRKVLAPRLIELGAIRPMIRFMTFKAMGKYTISDTAMLHKAYQECGSPKLLVIDPPSKFLGGIDEHKNSEVSHMLHLLVTWLEEFNVACILIMHINKQLGKGLEAVERIIGSVAWAASARMTVAFVRDPDNADQMICGGTKNNLGERAETLAYRIVKTDALAKVEWIGKTNTNMEDAMNQVKKKSRGVCATEWLADQFRGKVEWESSELRNMAAQAGISKNALWSPEVNALPIDKKKRTTADGEVYWVWRAQVGWPPQVVGNVGNVGNVGTESIDKKEDTNSNPF